jgi:hypothetical protein
MYRWRDQWMIGSSKLANILDLQDLGDELQRLQGGFFGCYMGGKDCQMQLCTVYTEFPKDFHYIAKPGQDLQ